jgi:hypothetical protein
MVQIQYRRMLNMSWTKKKKIEPKIGYSSHINGELIIIWPRI